MQGYLCELMAALTGDRRFTEQIEMLLERQKEKEGVRWKRGEKKIVHVEEL